MAAFTLAGKYLDSRSEKKDSTEKCNTTNKKIYAEISDNKINPPQIYGGFCDQLIVTNKDDKLRVLTFGEHDTHHSYDGVTQKALSKNQSLFVKLNQRGHFILHDHIEETVSTEFYVN